MSQELASDGPQTVNECRQMVERHAREVARLAWRIEQIGVRWEPREQTPIPKALPNCQRDPTDASRRIGSRESTGKPGQPSRETRLALLAAGEAA